METRTDQQLTAYFSDRASAEQAMDELLAAGVSQSNVELHDHASGGSGFLDSIKRFFSGESDEGDTSGSLLTVYGDRSVAAPILERYGGRVRANGIGSSAGAYDVADDARYGSDTSYTTGRSDDRTRQSMPLREERLEVDKQARQAGEVRLRKDVVTEQQSVDVPVSHEEVYVSRRPVSGTDYADRGDIGDNQEVTVPVMREEVSVEKRPYVTEEVALEKRTVQETKTVGGTVRKEKAIVDADGEIEQDVDDSTTRA